MTTAQKLQAIIRAQVKGGYDLYDVFDDGREIFVEETRYVKSYSRLFPGAGSSVYILEGLLDPAGLKAAYGEEKNRYEPFDPVKDPSTGIITNALPGDTFVVDLGEEEHDFQRVIIISVGWREAARRILDAWLATEGNAAKTIDTAYSLLPKE